MGVRTLRLRLHDKDKQPRFTHYPIRHTPSGETSDALPTFSDDPSEAIIAHILLNGPVGTDCLVFLAFCALHDAVIGLFEIE